MEWFGFHCCLHIRGSLIIPLGLNEYEGSWANAIEVAMELFIRTVEIIFRMLEVLGSGA